MGNSAKDSQRANGRYVGATLWRPIFFFCIFIVLSMGWADPSSSGNSGGKPSAGTSETPEKPAPVPQDEPRERSRYIFLGIVNNHPGLNDASGQIERQVNRPFRFLAPGFEDVRTFADQRDDFMIWCPFVGVGMTLSERWDAFAQAGYARGEVRTKASDPSILLLPLHTDVTFERSSFFAGPGLAFYPTGMPERRKFDSVPQRLKAAKPFVATTLSWNYLTFDANVHAGVGPLRKLVEKKECKEWDLWSLGLTVGLDVPTTTRSAVSVNLQYNRFLDHSGDFSGPALNVYWKKFF